MVSEPEGSPRQPRPNGLTARRGARERMRERRAQESIDISSAGSDAWWCERTAERPPARTAGAREPAIGM
jgi:hypothetical protein